MHNSVEHDFVFYVAWGELMHSHKVAIIMDLGVSKMGPYAETWNFYIRAWT